MTVNNNSVNAIPFEIKQNRFMGKGQEVQQFQTKVETALNKQQLSKDDYKQLKDSMTNGRQTLDSMLSSIGVPEQDIQSAFAKGNKGSVTLTDNQKTQLKGLLSGATTTELGKARDDFHKNLIETKYNGFRDPSDVKNFAADRKRADPNFNFSQVVKFVPFNTQRKMETDMMVNTLMNAGTPEKTATMQKIFSAMKQGGLQMRDKTGDIKPFPYDLSSALSHGNRVCFILPPGQEQLFNDWLKQGIPNDRSVVGVTASSHGIQPDQDDIYGFQETKSRGINVVGRDKNQDFGTNIAIGGKGQSSLNNAQIQDDGTFGHLLLVTNNNQNPSVTMVGIENSAPLKNDQWGGSHGIDCHKNAVSAVGSQKWSDLDAPDGKPQDLGGLIVDLRNVRISQLIESFNNMPKDENSIRALCTSTTNPQIPKKGILHVPELIQ